MNKWKRYEKQKKQISPKSNSKEYQAKVKEISKNLKI